MTIYGALAIYCIVLFFKAGHLSLFCKIHLFIKFSITVQNDIRMSDSFDDTHNNTKTQTHEKTISSFILITK
jgi:hypothetical protein